ncbi:MAG: ABC transporter permease [Thermoleophilia bacterium]
MRLSSIALRNVRRHLSRSALVLVVITASVAVVTSLYLVTRSAERDLQDKVDAYGANIVIVPRSDQLPLSYGGVQLGELTYDVEPLHNEDIATIRGIQNAKNINLIAPKLVETGDVGGVQTLVVGVEWDAELALKKWWTVVGEKPSSDHDALLGDRAAARLGLEPGDSFALRGADFRVSGTLGPTGTQEDDLVYLDLALTQTLWARPGELSFIEVSAWCATCPIEDINAQISAEMPHARVSALLKAAESRRILIGQFRLFALILSVLMVLVGCLIVLVSTLSSVRARRGEIGIFRSVGYRRRHILKIILLENLALAVVGAAAGLVIAVAVHGPIARAVAQVDTTLAPTARDLAVALVVSMAMVVLASLYPAARAAALSPTLAMKRV